MIRAFNGTIFEIDFARRERRLRVAAGVLGGVEAVFQPEDSECRRRIEAQRGAGL
jgi:hypothetical protein